MGELEKAGSWKRAGKFCKFLGAGNYLTYFEIYDIIKGEI